MNTNKLKVPRFETGGLHFFPETNHPDGRTCGQGQSPFFQLNPSPSQVKKREKKTSGKAPPGWKIGSSRGATKRGKTILLEENWARQENLGCSLVRRQQQQRRKVPGKTLSLASG